MTKQVCISRDKKVIEKRRAITGKGTQQQTGREMHGSRKNMGKKAKKVLTRVQ